MIEELVNILRAHLKKGIGGKCTCGYETPLGRDHNVHVASVIIEAGWKKP